ncbi:MAG: hemerythrin domain-containing protein [Ignavibacteria bacterium]
MDKIINTRITDIINNNFFIIDLFEKYNFNYSVNGNSTLGSILKENNVRPEKFINEYKNLNSFTAEHFKFSEWSVDFMCDYIVTNHHNYIRKIFPVMIRSAVYLIKRGKIKSDVSDKLKIIYSDFLTHMQKEEKFIFPQIKKISECEKSNDLYDIPPFGTISSPVKVILKEHEIAFENFSDIKRDCDNYKAEISEKKSEKKTGEDSDIDRIDLFNKMLRDFEIDLHLHFHFENNLLFPKAIKTEKKLLKNNSKKYLNRIKKSKNE